MKRRHILTAFVSALALHAPSLHAAQRIAPPWSTRDVFVFGSSLIDFRAGVVSFDRRGQALENCSTNDVYCAKSPTIRLVLPRRCDALTARAAWTQAGVTTKVLSVDSSNAANREVLSLLPTKVYLLGSEQSPSVVYLYTREHGVQAIYYDGAEHRNLVAMAQSGGLAGLSRGLGMLMNFKYPKTTVDPFGLCDAPKPVRGALSNRPERLSLA